VRFVRRFIWLHALSGDQERRLQLKERRRIAGYITFHAGIPDVTIDGENYHW
jgi:hypothetical protein